MNSKFSIPPSRENSRIAASRQPNLIWLMADQHRFHATGYAGDRNLHTPNIDQLAASGFTPANGGVAGYALCCPFRGSLLTGVYPHHCVPGHEKRMPEHLPTVAHAFNEAGYDTAWFGKWHVDGCRESEGRAAFWVVPPERRGGFKEWIGYENNGSQFDTWVHGGRNGECEPRKLPGYETDSLTDLLLDYLERQADHPEHQPFFAALSVTPPHWPMQCPPDFIRTRPDEIELRPNVPPASHAEASARWNGPGYYGMIENWDWNIGRVVARLRELDLAHSTHIVLFADHGEMLGSHGHFGKVLPYEESIRTPFIIGGADQEYNGLKGNRKRQHGAAPPPHSDVLINHVDIAPTSLGLCGIEVPSNMKGYDYSFTRKGGNPASPVSDCALLQAIGSRLEQSPAYRGILTRDGWKYVCRKESAWQMFDLNDDPFEMANLAHRPGYAEKRDALHAQLSRKLAEVGDGWSFPESQ